jgi:hypothetical protein
VPPEVTTSTRQPRSSAERNDASVSAVFPEYEEATTNVCGSQCSGRTGERFTSTGRPRRSTNTERTTSPDTADPPIPQNVTDVTSCAGGRPSARRAEVIGRAAIVRHESTASACSAIRKTQRLRIVEIGHRLPPRFSAGLLASSISIAGMSSRTGYRYHTFDTR